MSDLTLAYLCTWRKWILSGNYEITLYFENHFHKQKVFEELAGYTYYYVDAVSQRITEEVGEGMRRDILKFYEEYYPGETPSIDLDENLRRIIDTVFSGEHKGPWWEHWAGLLYHEPAHNLLRQIRHKVILQAYSSLILSRRYQQQNICWDLFGTVMELGERVLHPTALPFLAEATRCLSSTKTTLAVVPMSAKETIKIGHAYDSYNLQTLKVIEVNLTKVAYLFLGLSLLPETVSTLVWVGGIEN